MKHQRFDLNVPFELTKSGRKDLYVTVDSFEVDGAVDVLLGTCSCVLKQLADDAIPKLSMIAKCLAEQKFADSMFVNQNGELCMN